MELDPMQLQERNKSLEAEVRSFGQQRAYFMHIYKRKEDEALKLQEQLNDLTHVNGRLESDIKGIRQQVSDMKTEHTITLISKDEQIEQLKSMHQQELSSLNTSMQDMLEESSERKALLSEIKHLKQRNSELNAELETVRSSLQAKVQQQLHKPHQNASTSCSSERCDEEKKSMRMQLDAAHGKLQHYADSQMDSTSSAGSGTRKHKGLFEVVDQEERVKELETELKLEKSSRRDLEMYVAVLAQQKEVFQTDVENIRREHSESLALLEKERKDYKNLRLTWQMANDQFLEDQRLLMIDMRRLESVLTEEQQRRVAELQKEDAEREAQQKKIKELEKQRQEQIQKLEAEVSPILDLTDGLRSSSSRTSLNSVDVYGEFERAEPVDIGGFSSPSPGGSVERELTPHTHPLPDTPSIAVSDVLTKDMQNALLAPQQADIENKKFLDNLRADTPDKTNVPAGSRVVSGEQWTKLQEELQSSRAKLGRPCDMCSNYEATIQKEQEKYKSLESQLAQSRQNVKNQKRIIDELEEKMKTIGEENRKEIESLSQMLRTADEQIFILKDSFNEAEQMFRARLLSLAKERTEVLKELKKVELENEQLLDMHSKTSQEMVDERFVQPETLAEAHQQLNDYREKLIDTKAASEHLTHKLKAQIQVLKDQNIATEFEWKNKETILNQEISSLEEKNVRLESMESEMTREAKLRLELEEKLQMTSQALESSKSAESHHKSQLQNLLTDVEHVKQRNQQLKDQVKTLQLELTNSESVQKDFVSLSQQLQIQLEKIRQAETEVRWEYEDDIDKCSSCAVNFTNNREKHHCMHCGKVHCQECTSKIVKAGPKLRPTRVCGVCHTILVSDAKPYFSTESNNKA